MLHILKLGSIGLGIIIGVYMIQRGMIDSQTIDIITVSCDKAVNIAECVYHKIQEVIT
jgi:hypothetical protein